MARDDADARSIGSRLADPAASAEIDAREASASVIHAEAIRTLYRDSGASAAATTVCVCVVAAAAWSYSPHSTVVLWLAANVALQLVRFVLLRVYHRRAPNDAGLRGWAVAYALFMLAAGLAWGAAALLFIDTNYPMTVIFTLSALFAITGGSVPSNAYHPLGYALFIGATFTGVLMRFSTESQQAYRVIGISCVAFGVIMILFCRAHTANIYDSLRIRFENRDLVRALTRKTEEVEAALADARRANLAKSQFLAAASHDLRQPLYALGLFSASLGLIDLDDEGRRIVADIRDSVDAMESLFVGLLDLSKLEAGTVRPSLAPVSLETLFDQLSQYFRPVAIERQVDLRFRPDDLWVESDPALLEQVMSNLVSNALRATTRGGVLVAARRRRGRVALEVWDTGGGIPAGDHERVFEAFVQLDNPERDRRKGLGLGLSIARRSAALLGSDIELASWPGKGSRFRIEQPGWMTGEEGATSPAPAIAELSRDRMLPLLVVENDVAARKALCSLLARWGVAFEAAVDAEGALAWLGEKQFGLVLSDFRLGGAMDGLALIEAIRTRPAPRPAVALITGDVDAGVIRLADRRDIPLLPKPVGAARLRTLLGLDGAGEGPNA